MCGIAGFLGRGGDAELSAMASAIAHRGPDGEGYFVDAQSGLGLAHRRLAIIDLSSAAAQPMASCEGRYRVVFNGEIYNFRNLATELRPHGYEFNSNSDTAVLGPLYDRYGIGCLQKLNGIFAFALWDSRERELIVARDAFGVKPLYFSATGGALVFASELKALLAPSILRLSVDETALLDYLVHLWSPGRRTPLRGVEKLLPGHLIRARRGAIEIERWYSPPAGVQRREGGLPKGRAPGEVRKSFDRAVATQCVSDAPIGAFLSGGVDSSAIVAAMVESGHAPKRAYCIGFDGSSMEDEGFSDDLTFARAMAGKLSVPLTEIRVGEPEPDDLAALPFMLDEPQADPAALYVAAIGKAARADGIKVLLSGAGGDDIFSGYRRHQAAALRSRLGPFSRLLRVPFTAGAGSNAFKRRLAKLGYLFEGTEEEFLIRAFEFNRRESALACLSPEAVSTLGVARNGWLHEAVVSSRGAPLVDRMLHLELHGFLPDHNLNYTDKAAMAHGVEVRVPFLDMKLVELASRIPWQLKTRGLKEKWIFKRAMDTRLPPEVLWRKKTGFGGPVRVWFSRGRLRELAEDIFSSQRFRERGLFTPAAVQALLRETSAGRKDSAYLVFAVLMVEFWLQRFVDQDMGKPSR